MLRVILTGLLLGVGLVVAPASAAEPAVCPPACDRIPAAAWVAPAAIPLNDTQHWPAPATVAVPGPATRFRFEELCPVLRPFDDPRSYAVASTATVVRPDRPWQLQAQILHWRGDPALGGQLAGSVFDAAVGAVRGCLAVPHQISTDEPSRFAAVLTGPQLVVHQYLVVDPANSTVSELALSAPPNTPVPWPDIADKLVLDAISTPLCAAYLGSCG